MLISPLDGTIGARSVHGGNLGGSSYGGIDPGRPHEDLEALEAHVRESTGTKAKFLAELRPIRTVGGTALSGVVGAALRLAPR